MLLAGSLLPEAEQPDPDLRAGGIVTVSEDLSLGGKHPDQVPRGGITLDLRHGAGEEPGMAPDY
jgi:hypothetical protein